jgi:hypothetical protein
VQIVPAYRNKWPRWTDFWFYHHVCSDEDVTPMAGFRLAKIMADSPRDTAATDAFALTSRWQISRDLVEESLACESPPLSQETWFSGFVRKDGYVFPNLGVSSSDVFSSDFSLVNLIEHKADEIIGPYGKREHKGKCEALAGERRLN